ncbi:hypothetical protein EMIHUDRAFT_431729 [Emiliania huxleyi CCMP1516]|uniref:Uncharacterized protein n=2 Tax=Emiliania huxleyi TaxID=2903 RepID=A0A0D3L0T0_EMIH1|nr:hypothetical protein EMIHUDRAFT_431729 [Emiliania huxleyi CCMP1516]EOD41615.1 hypothetical protein EMIHUDRAFT_431729 [Emiliania huxleyi CCMP1516]|eukprot:XP_005794044.1 hypothetical protein EMIHUDRAFT_431729 [Emiliania huxleyi CCMP1516]
MRPDTPPERAPKRASAPLAEPPSRQRTAPRPGRQRVAKREASVPRRRQEVAPGPLAGSGTRRARCCHRGGSHRKTQRRRKRVGGSEHERFVAQNETAAVAACEGGGGAASGRDGPGGSRSSGRSLAEH